MELRWNVVFDNLGFLLWGAVLTLTLVSAASVIGLALGIVGSLAKQSRFRLLRGIAAGYVEVFRNTPLLIQLYFIYFALPSWGLNFDSNSAALIALSLNAGAYMTEIVRAGVESINSTQLEAAQSLGMSPMQIFRHVVLAPAVRAVAPPLSNQFIWVLLSSAIVVAVAAQDLTYRGQIIENRTFRAFEVYIAVTVIYFILAQSLALALKTFNRYVLRCHVPERPPSTL